MFGVSFARLDIPSEPPRTEYKNPSAIYGLTPVTEQQVRDRHRPYTPSKLLADVSEETTGRRCRARGLRGRAVGTPYQRSRPARSSGWAGL